MALHVGVIGPRGEDDFATHVATGLQELGISVTQLGPTGSHRWRPVAPRARGIATDLLRQHPTHGWRTETHLVRAARSAGLDLVITVQSLHPETVRSLDRYGIPVILWFPDHVSNLGALWMFDAPYTNLFFKEPVLVERMKQIIGLPIDLLHEACNPLVHRPPTMTSKRPTIGVVGNMYATRLKLLERLVHDGYELEVYGNPPPRWSSFTGKAPYQPNGYVRGAAKAEVFRNAGVVLNSMHPAEIDGVNCRLFEAAGCGAALLCETRSSINELFADHHDLETFSTYAQLRASLNQLLGDPARAVEIGDNASRRAHADHTYAIRLREMLTVAGFGSSLTAVKNASLA